SRTGEIAGTAATKASSLSLSCRPHLTSGLSVSVPSSGPAEKAYEPVEGLGCPLLRKADRAASGVPIVGGESSSNVSQLAHGQGESLPKAPTLPGSATTSGITPGRRSAAYVFTEDAYILTAVSAVVRALALAPLYVRGMHLENPAIDGGAT